MLHAAVLAYVSDISNGLVELEGTEMRSGPSLDHAIWFHRPVRVDEWVWQDLVPHTAAGGAPPPGVPRALSGAGYRAAPAPLSSPAGRW
jgi:hypothetical protein